MNKDKSPSAVCRWTFYYLTAFAKRYFNIVKLAIHSPIIHANVSQIVENEIGCEQIFCHIIVIVISIEATLKLKIGNCQLIIYPQTYGILLGIEIIGICQAETIGIFYFYILI